MDDENTCSDCAGEGYIDGVRCETCKGAGTLQVITSDDEDKKQ